MLLIVVVLDRLERIKFNAKTEIFTILCLYLLLLLLALSDNISKDKYK